MTASHRSNRRRSRTAIRRALLGCETLESRQLLAIDTIPPLLADSSEFRAVEPPAATLHYFAGSEKIEMQVHPQRIALSLATQPPATQSPELTVPELPELLAGRGFNQIRELADGFAVYEFAGTAAEQELHQAVARLKSEGVAIQSAPVFVLQATGSEAVLLDELIVSLEPGVEPDAYFAKNEMFDSYRPLSGTPNQFVATVADGVGERALAALQLAQRDADPAVVQWIEPNFYQDWQKYYIPNDPRFGNLWHLHNTGQNGALVDADSDLPEAWDLNAGGSTDYVIGIIDDGVADHPDLNLWANPGEIPNNGIDDDNNGWIDDIRGWNFVSNNNQAGPTTSLDSHGTAVAGVAAAMGDNAVGVTGASYNSRVSSARIFQGNSVASDANIASSLYYMAGRTANGLGTWKSADLVNNSWGGGGFSNAINGALVWGTIAGRLGAGTPYFFASGNDFSSSVSYPASQASSIAGVFAVGATNSRGTRSNYSNFGSALDFVAPSNDTRSGYLAIDTTDRVGSAGYDPTDYTGTGANGFGGTSSATPLAAGIAALVMDQADDLGVTLSPAQLKAYLRNATDLIGGLPYNMSTGTEFQHGYGRLNAATAVAGIGTHEISVLSAFGELTDGASSISVGTRYLDEPQSVTFRIRNQGTNSLELSAVTISAGEFSIITPPSDMSLALGEATSFTIRFAASTLGTHTATVTILSNDTDEGVFTFDVTGRATVRSISGSIAEDWDGDGQKDPEDVLLSGRVVFVDENGNGQLDGGERSATTDASGFYFFDEVPVGSYQVRSVAVAGWTMTGTPQHPITIHAPGDVFRDVDFTSVKNDRFYAIVYDDADADGTFDSDELPFADRRLLVDSNGNGIQDTAFNTYLDDTPTLIPNLSTVTRTVMVDDGEFPIIDVDVRVNINMLWNSQLQVFLEHPDGTIVELFTSVGGASDNFIDTILDDQAPTSIASGTGPFTGRFRPEGLLSVLNGKSSNGTWSLRISDPFGGDEATLNEWELMITTGESVKTTGTLGTTYFDLQAGTYDVQLLTLAGWDHTQPVGGVRTVTPDGTPLVAQYYGSRKLPPAISGYVVEDWNGNGLREAQDRPLLGRTVFIDQNNNGVFEDALESNTFLQSTPSNIPNSATILSPLEVSGFSGVLTDVNVSLDITHSWVSDLDVALIAPDGTRVVLFEDIGGANDNFRDTVLDDEATTPISSGSAPYTGSFRPFGQLSDFDSMDPNGTWYLEVTDDFGLNDGTLNRWGLVVTAGEQSTSTDGDGFYQFDVLPNGSYNIRSVAEDDWIVTGDNHYNVTITSPLDSFAELTFGSGKNNRLYTTVFNDTNADGILGTSEAPLSERTVFIDTNGNGTVDELLNSIVDTNTYVVPDRSRINAPLAVAIMDSPILDVDVRVNITSSFNFEVETHLIHPDGTRVELFTNVGSSSQNFTNTILDDQAATPITSGSAPFTGRYRPEGLLSVLNGKSPNGTWQLEVRDIFTGNFLRLNEWELMIRTAEVDLTTDDVGTAYQDLLPGTYEVALLSVENWNHTLPIDGRRTVTTDGTPLFNQTFGSMEVELVPPTIVASIAAGTTWSSSFIAGVDGEGTGNGLGMALLAGMSSLPFSNVNRLYIQFSEPVTQVVAANIELRDSHGTLPFNLVFDQNSNLATLELPSPLPAGKYRLSASDAIADLSGNPLDGDASGDAGGIFTIRFDVMPSDTTGDRRVGTDDLFPFGPAFNSQIGQTAYNWRIDWNADGRIATNDLLIFAAHFNQRIDNLSEPGAPFGGGGSGSGLFYMAAPPRDTNPWDSFYNQLGSRDDEREELELLGLKN